jgi:hypothetical protein
MSNSIESPTEAQVQAGMIVLGADTALVGEVLSIGRELMLIVRRPLPAIKLPLALIQAVVDGVAVLTVSADTADALGEVDDGHL